MWPFTKLEKRIDQLQLELAEMRLRIKEMEKELNENLRYVFALDPACEKQWEQWENFNKDWITIKPFDDYLKGRLSKDEIKKIKQDAKKEAENLDATNTIPPQEINI